MYILSRDPVGTIQPGNGSDPVAVAHTLLRDFDGGLHGT
jgi:hypothetical protein